MVKKRVVTKIGDIFCVELGDGTKGYFQYIYEDACLLGSDVIRVFKTHYHLEKDPSVEEIINDEVDFYSHTFIRVGIEFDAWSKIGNSVDLGLAGLQRIVFCTLNDSIFIDYKLVKVDPLENWFVWRIGAQQPENIGKLPAEFVDITEPGFAFSYNQILTRMRYGYYTMTYEGFEILKRRPRPEVHSYTRVEGDDVVYYFHFLGENVVEEIVVENGVSALLTPQSPSAHGQTLREAPFYATNWKHREFITREEFEEAKS